MTDGIPRLRIFNANIESKGNPTGIDRELDEHNPHLAILTEAYNARSSLQKTASQCGYVLKQYGTDQGAEGPDIAVLVRANVTIVKRDPMKMKEPWWGPNTGKKRQPRVYVKLLLADPDLPGDLNWKVIAVHFPPGGPKGGTSANLKGKNKAAWAESRDRCVDWANGHPEGPFVLAGDINAHRDEVKAEVVKRLTGTIHLTSWGPVDHAVLRRTENWNEKKCNVPYGHGWGWAAMEART